MIIDLAYVTDPFIGNGVIKKEGTERCDVTESRLRLGVRLGRH